MKSIVVEGKTDSVVLQTLFPDMMEKEVSIRIAQGFSNVLATSKTLIDYGYEVLAMLDTDSKMPGKDIREIVKRMQSSGVAGRTVDIVWMDSCIEDVLRKANPVMFSKKAGGVSLKQAINKNKDALLALEEFKKIQEFING